MPAKVCGARARSARIRDSAFGSSLALVAFLSQDCPSKAFCGLSAHAAARRITRVPRAAELEEVWLPRVQVDVFSDVVCPWCYVGIKNLDMAVQEFGRDRVEVKWYHFITESGVDAGGEEYAAYNRRRWGSDGWTFPLRQMGAEAGASFRSWRWWPVAMPAHCLVSFSESRGLSAFDAAAAIWEALFEEGANVSEVETLAQLAASKLSLDQEEVIEHLRSDSCEGVVLRNIEMWSRHHRVSSVPHFIVSSSSCQQQYSFSGAHPSDQFLELFRKVCQEQ